MHAESFQYDADGNLTQDGRWNYIWDGENRLLRTEMRADVAAQTSTTAHAIENLYDSQGRRVRVVESILSPSLGWMFVGSRAFLYDGWNLLVESDSANSSQRSYVWGIDASGTLQGAGGVGGLLWATADSQTHVAGYDANGNIIAWVNASTGHRSGTREYGAFGENVAATGVGVLDEWSGIPFGFSTKYQDRLTNHYYCGYRFYDTSSGRWLSRDPIEEQGGLNLYAFVGNNGVNRWDLLGNISLGAKIFFIFETRRQAGLIKYLFEPKLPVYYLSDDEDEMKRPFMINIVEEAIERYIKKTSQGADGRYQLSSVDLRKYSNSILYYESATFFGTGW